MPIHVFLCRLMLLFLTNRVEPHVGISKYLNNSINTWNLGFTSMNLKVAVTIKDLKEKTVRDRESYRTWQKTMGYFSSLSRHIQIQSLSSNCIEVSQRHSRHNLALINYKEHCTKKWSFSLRISSVNVTKSTDRWFRHIYWRNS